VSQDTPNPFALPGMSAAFMNSPNNPLLTSMDMMRQAMGSMGYGAKGSSSDTMVNPMAPEELEKRISDLRTVENWLKLNLSMLSSTIQGMEVQLATVKTLQSFVAMGQSVGTTDATEASPLEIALGLKHAPYKPKAPPKAKAQDTVSEPLPKSANPNDPQQAAALDWWKMLEGQFAQIAAATANAAKASNGALQKTAGQNSTRTSTRKASTTKPRATKKAANTSRTPKKEV
jgi:hypothetical protein